MAPTAEQVRSLIDSYKAAFDNKDRDTFLACFREDAVQIDPVTTSPNVGKAAIAAFWDGVSSLADSFNFDLQRVNVCGNHAAMVFTITTRSADGAAAAIDIVDTLEIDDHGLITSLKAYWDPAEMRPLPTST